MNSNAIATKTIPYNRSHVGERELGHVQQAMAARSLAGDGAYGRRCQAWLTDNVRVKHAMLTHSATGALEMAALLCDLQPGDEVIMPSFTFVSTANAFVLRGAVPVFVDIRADTLNLDEKLVEAAVTSRTRAIVPVHYAGVSCAMDEILAIARRRSLLVVEDAAQGLMATYQGRPLGGLGDMGALSFHGTKNIHCGEGGAFLTPSNAFGQRAEIIREKGTNRSRFFRGEVDKYTWVDTGSSYLPSELNAAFLFGQFEEAEEITRRRMEIWNRYHTEFEALERDGLLRRPIVPADCGHNAHIYYVLLPDSDRRTRFIDGMKARGIGTTFHYVPLHESDHAPSCTRVGSAMTNTSDLAARLARLPVWPGLEPEMDRIVEATIETAASLC